jgi:hypothetical protein
VRPALVCDAASVRAARNIRVPFVLTLSLSMRLNWWPQAQPSARIDSGVGRGSALGSLLALPQTLAGVTPGRSLARRLVCTACPTNRPSVTVGGLIFKGWRCYGSPALGPGQWATGVAPVTRCARRSEAPPRSGVGIQR